ncbi:hypothetical protein EXIGLDRAFT_312778 [Exidia glandulosa HHB12029]|uniref:Uncharacterized protein n=1 Tax=Exidia glandulosa HHB12029 TaxID=1314781 RepID=A0A165CYZ5_EXIGL|nr:hypothetical protein EXIGLDRAFT_312778 [Exidia glandulosa HHB12029]
MERKCYPSCDPGQNLAVAATSMVGRRGKKLPSPLAVVRLGLAVHWTTGSFGVCAQDRKSLCRWSDLGEH